MLFQKISGIFPEIEKACPHELLNDFMNTPYHQMDRFHFGLGQWIRQQYLKPCDPLFQQFQCCGVMLEDDMSSLILQLFYIHLHQIPFSSSRNT